MPDLRIQPQSMWPHVAVIAIGALLAVILISFILYIRPNYDPVALIGTVGGAMALATTQIISILKQSQHDQQSREIGQNVVGSVEVVAEKIDDVKLAPVVMIANRRAAEQNVAAKVGGDRRGPSAAPSAPVPVQIIADTPVPVVLADKKEEGTP